MEILRLCAIGLVTALLATMLRQQKSIHGVLVSLAGGCLLLFYTLPYMRDILSYIGELSAEIGLKSAYVGAMVRVIAVAFITECTAALCRDVGESALAAKLEMAGKLVILGVSMPIIRSLFSTVVSILP